MLSVEAQPGDEWSIQEPDIMQQQSDIIRGNQAAADYIGGISLVTLWRLSQTADFPRKIKLSTRAVGYRKSELDAWLATRQGEVV